MGRRNRADEQKRAWMLICPVGNVEDVPLGLPVSKWDWPVGVGREA